jgi:hypothetical protein
MADVKNAIKVHVVPDLRKRGFSGSFPHFRRITETSTHLITFQFDKHGSGNFVVELAKAPAGDFQMYWGEIVPAKKLTAHHINDRFRLRTLSSTSDCWFNSQDFTTTPTAAAQELLRLLDTQGEQWLSGT